MNDFMFLIRAELYKFTKKKLYILPLIVAFMPVILALLINIKVSGLEIEGTFYLTTFGFSMWQFLWAIFLPQIVIIYIVSSLNYSDEHQKELTYEVTKNSSMTLIIFSKLITITLYTLSFFGIFYLNSILGVLLFIKNTGTYSSEFYDNSMAIQCMFSIFVLIIIGFAIYVLLTYIKTLISVFLIFVLQTIISMSSNSVSWWEYIPGSILYNHNFSGNITPIIIQGLLLVLILIGLFIIKILQFNRKKILS